MISKKLKFCLPTPIHYIENPSKEYVMRLLIVVSVFTFFLSCSSNSLQERRIAAVDKDLSDIVDARIVLDDDNEGLDNPNGGLIYSGEKFRYGKIQLIDSDRDVLDSIPVKIKISGVGATAMFALFEVDGKMSLGLVRGKKIKDLLGSYYGIKLAAAVLMGAKGILSVNKAGVILKTISMKGSSLGVDLSATKVTIFKNKKAPNYSSEDLELEIGKVND